MNQTYRSLRVIDGEDEWVYGVWCTGERELFNLKVQLVSPLSSMFWFFDSPQHDLPIDGPISTHQPRH